MSGLDLYHRNASGMGPAPYVPTRFGEVAAANTYAFSLQQNLGLPKIGYHVAEAVDFAERGKLIKDRFQVKDQFDLIDTSDIDAKYSNPTADGRIAMLNEKQARLDDFIEKQRAIEPDKWQGIKTKKEIEAPLINEAKSAARIAGDITSRAPAFSATAGTLLGGFGGAMTDVVNISTLPVGFGSSMGILKTMAAEGALNAAIEASQVKGRAEWMNTLGMKYGVKEAAMDIAFAGAGSAAIVGAVRGGGAAVRSMRQRGSKGVEVLSDLADNRALPNEARDALKYQARVAHIDEENPVVKPTPDEVAAHRVNLDETQKAVREFREPVYVEDHFTNRAVEIKADLDRLTKTSYDPQKPSSLKPILGYTPRSLTQFIKENGGIQDIGGELRAADLQRIPGLLRKDNAKQGTAHGVQTVDNTVDYVKQKAFDAGYFPEKTDYNDITNDEFFDAISQDAGGKRIYTIDDQERIAQATEGDFINQYDRQGISPGMSVDEIADVLRWQADDIIPFDIVSKDPHPLETMRADVEAGDEAIPAFEADFARLLKDEPDMEIDMDGVKMRLSDVADEIRQNNNILNAIRTCAIG